MKEYFDEISVEDEVASIENAKPAQRLQETTQILVPMTGRDSIVKNRLTHSYEVATSARRMAAYMAKELGFKLQDIDYTNSLKQVCLLHDIGHAPFGHDGQKEINKIFLSKGLEEGFSDNNNNLVVLESNDIKVRDYVKASIIKYPEKLYKNQKEKYLKILSDSIEQDREHFKTLGINLKDQKITMTAWIMDEADRNSYTCSDLTDFFSLKNKVELNELINFFNNDSIKEMLLLKQMVEAVETGNSRVIRDFFSELKTKFNENFKLTDNGLEIKDKDLFNFRESLSNITYEFFIKKVRKEDFHLNNVEMLKLFINNALEDGYCKSTTYREKIKNSSSKKEKLELVRDMVAEVSDWFVIKYGNNIMNQEIEKELGKEKELKKTFKLSK